jgi:hypothetical protein
MRDEYLRFGKTASQGMVQAWQAGARRSHPLARRFLVTGPRRGTNAHCGQ